MSAFSRRRLVSLVAGLALAGPALPAIAQTTFKIGISSPSVSILSVYFAEGDVGKKHGLNVEVVSAEGGTRGLQVLMSGEIQAMHVGLAPMVQANNKDADLRMIGASLNTLPFVVYATKKSNPPIPKGSVVGISTFGSETDIAMSIVLRNLGLYAQGRGDYAARRHVAALRGDGRRTRLRRAPAGAFDHGGGRKGICQGY